MPADAGEHPARESPLPSTESVDARNAASWLRIRDLVGLQLFKIGYCSHQARHARKATSGRLRSRVQDSGWRGTFLPNMRLSRVETTPFIIVNVIKIHELNDFNSCIFYQEI